MADPVTLGLTLASTAASAGLQGVQSYQKAAVERAQASADRVQAQNAAATGSYNAGEQLRKRDYLMSEQLARQAASGGGTGGSALAVRAATGTRGTYNARMAQWEGNEQAGKLNYEATLQNAAAQNTEAAAPFQIGATVLSGLSNAAQKYPNWTMNFSQPQPWDTQTMGPAQTWNY